MNQFAKPGLAEEKLPPVSTADNGKVLGVNNGVWEKVAASGGSDLPEVTSSDKDKYLHTNSSTGDLEWSDVSGGGGGEFVVTFSGEPLLGFSPDKTVSEIHDAATAGKTLVAKCVDTSDGSTLFGVINCTHISEGEDYATAIFTKYVANELVCNIVYWTGSAWSNAIKQISNTTS